jgi:hypothetical protein
MRDDAADVLHSVLDFVGVAADLPLDASAVANEATTSRSPLVSRALDGVANLPLKRLVPQSTRQKIVSVSSRIRSANTKRFVAPPLDDDIRQYLAETLASEIKGVEDLLGRTLPLWTRPARSLGA